MKCLIIDNYDSFTFNLYQYLGEILEGKKVPYQLNVIRNDEQSFEQIEQGQYDRIVISPGPGDPADSNYFGVCSEVLIKLAPTTKTLGICLGMQGMVHYYGGKVGRSKLPMHGKTSQIWHDSAGAYQELPQSIEVMRYHSLVVEPEHIPDDFLITALTQEREVEPFTRWKDQVAVRQYAEENQAEVMGVRHRKYPLEGIQFHPESFATEGGKSMLKQFLR